MRVKCDKPVKMSERYLKVKHTIGFGVCQLPVGCHKVSNCSFLQLSSLHFTFYSLSYPLFPTALPHSLFFILLKAAWSINSQGTGGPLIPHGPVKGHIIRCSVRGVKLMFLQPLITSLTMLKRKCPSRAHLHFMPVFKCALFASESCLFLWDFFYSFKWETQVNWRWVDVRWAEDCFFLILFTTIYDVWLHISLNYYFLSPDKLFIDY